MDLAYSLLGSSAGHHTYFVDLEDDAQTMQEYAIDRPPDSLTNALRIDH